MMAEDEYISISVYLLYAYFVIAFFIFQNNVMFSIFFTWGIN